jgi:Cd2+/Zn2+-exporting ATPase
MPVLAGSAEMVFDPVGMPDRWSSSQQEVLRWAAIAEAGSGHPLSRPILTEASALFEIPPADEFENHTGKGIHAIYQGHSVWVGSPDLIRAAGINTQAGTQIHLERLSVSGKTAVIVAMDGIELGILGIADPPRPTALAMLNSLKAIGIDRVVMLTGDDRRTAQAIAREVGITDVRAELLPEHKLDNIRQLQKEGYVVAMIGDGINDAPALAAADIGMAMGAAGTDVAIETADIALMTDDLLKIPEAIGLSKATLQYPVNVSIALLTVGSLLGRAGNSSYGRRDVYPRIVGADRRAQWDAPAARHPKRPTHSAFPMPVARCASRSNGQVAQGHL